MWVTGQCWFPIRLCLFLLRGQDGFGLINHELEHVLDLALHQVGVGGDLSADRGGQRLHLLLDVAGEGLQLLLELLNHGLELGSALLEVLPEQTQAQTLVLETLLFTPDLCRNHRRCIRRKNNNNNNTAATSSCHC